MPVRDAVLADAPAEVDPLALAFGREVDETALRVPQEDALARQALELRPQGRGRIPVVTPGVGPAAVRHDLLLHHLGLPQDHLARVADAGEPLAKRGEQRVGLVHVVEVLLGHHDTPRSAGSWSIAVMRGPGASRNRARRSISTGNIPSASAGSTSNS